MLNTGKFLDEFVAESREHLESVEADLLNLEKLADNSDNELVNNIFRGIHSIKGAAGFLGLDKIGELAHIMETLLSMIRAGDILPETDSIDALLSGVDILNKMLGDPEGAADSSSVLNNIQNILTEKLLPKVIDEIDTSIPILEFDGGDTGFAVDEYTLKKFSPETSLYVLKYDLVELAGYGEQSPVSLLRKLTEIGEIVDSKIDAPSDDLSEDLNEIPLAWDVLFATFTANEIISEKTGLSPERIVEVKKAGDETGGESSIAANSQIEDIGARIGETGKDADSSDESHKLAEGDKNIRVPEERLDQLVNLVGELVTVQANLSREAGVQNKNPTLLSISREIERLTGELRDLTLDVRMVPIEKMFDRFRRLARDVSGEQHKEVVLATEGGETELDKKVIEKLLDPFAHIIRNAIAHGIEPGDRREACGKPRQGTIRLSAKHTSGNVLISISDDGGGLDVSAIGERAVELGISIEGLSENEIFELIFIPGFSTSGQIDGVSGRGVGMDVVKRGIDSLGGSIEVTSEKGAGTVITMKIPMTLAIIDGLLVKIEEENFVFPLSAVRECLMLKNGELESARKNNIMRLEGKVIPYFALREILGIKGRAPDLERVIITNTIRKNIGFGVDRVIGHHKTVIKTLGKIYRETEGVAGATILGDGTVALILDVNKLVRGK